MHTLLTEAGEIYTMQMQQEVFKFSTTTNQSLEVDISCEVSLI